MAESDVPHEDDVFDVDRVERLVELMEQHDLSVIDLRRGAERIRLRRGAPAPTVISAPAAPAPAPVAPSAAPAPGSAPAAGGAEAEDGPNIAYIRSPTVGTFYAKPNPKATDPFVKVGDRVEPDTIVCVIEAMKIFSEIPAEVSGKIVAVLVDNEEPVDHGKPLFKIDTSK